MKYKVWLDENHQKNTNYSHIGDIEFFDVLKEQEINSGRRLNLNSIGECKIEVYGPNEGNIPHFHLYSKDMKSFRCCIRIYDANYFIHGNKYTDTLSSKQCDQLNKWLKETHPKLVGTNWQRIVAAWEQSNPDCKFDERNKIVIQPDYSKMVNFRD